MMKCYFSEMLTILHVLLDENNDFMKEVHHRGLKNRRNYM